MTGQEFFLGAARVSEIHEHKKWSTRMPPEKNYTHPTNRLVSRPLPPSTASMLPLVAEDAMELPRRLTGVDHATLRQTVSPSSTHTFAHRLSQSFAEHCSGKRGMAGGRPLKGGNTERRARSAFWRVIRRKRRFGHRSVSFATRRCHRGWGGRQVHRTEGALLVL